MPRARTTRAGGGGRVPPRAGAGRGAPPRAGRGRGRRGLGGGGGAREQGKGRARGGGRRGGRGRERGEGEESSPRGPNSGDRRLQFLGHHGEREVEEGEGGCCAGDPNERERGGGTWGRCGRQGRAGPGRAEPLNGIKSLTEIRNGTRRTRNIRQRNAPRHDATPVTLRFWFIHDTDTCHYIGLKLGRRSETGKRKESNARIW
jgi:hypothetical protein